MRWKIRAVLPCKNSGLLINWKQDNEFLREVFGGADAGTDMLKRQTRAPEGLEARYEKYRGMGYVQQSSGRSSI